MIFRKEHVFICMQKCGNFLENLFVLRERSTVSFVVYGTVTVQPLLVREDKELTYKSTGPTAGFDICVYGG